MMNKAILVGRLTHDPDQIFQKESGKEISRFQLAVNSYKEQVDFIKIVQFGQQANFCNTYLKKGRLVGIEGKIRVEEYETEGGKRKSFSVIVDNVTALDSPKSSRTKTDSSSDKQDRTTDSHSTENQDTTTYEDPFKDYSSSDEVPF